LQAVDGVRDCDLVVSVAPPASAVDVARSIGRFEGLFVDVNAVSPATAEEVARLVEANGATSVDGSVIGPPPSAVGTTRLYLSGEEAPVVAAVFSGTVLEVIVLPGPFAAASALKMGYGSWTKGSAALLLAAHATADQFGVGDALEREWARDREQPALLDQLQSAQNAAVEKGWRWAAEMQENARTFLEAGQPAGFGEASAVVFDRFERPAGS
jgi:3-hydroxyisobutyrate dehydrogenase-like beta-hydroxyacid dehydrogenase